MADRILTKGLKTGTGAGGVKYILLRGLVSSTITALVIGAERRIFTLDTDRRVFTIDTERRIFTTDTERRVFDVD